MKRNALWLLAAVLATGLIAAGCGDDDDDDGGEESISKEDFVAQGNQICEEGDAEIDAAAEETFGNAEPSQEEVDAFVNDSVVPGIQGQIDDLRDLGAPEGDEDELDGIYEDAEAALSDIEADPTLVQGDQDPFADVSQRLSDYGLTACGSGGGE
jgi:hypothetical protein